ncbi:MAG: tetratricopeptide repeat protein [Nitrospirota bacterium]|nr:tetratricopeptide repeat protein [Nitrospirota bacterium]
MEKDTSEIAKLSERIAKDPKSKLFVPLAEEYKKVGQIDMAIVVLSEGLKNNPGYATARSFLGRLLLEQGDLAGAQKELEEVVKTIPDNLLAQRKLGDLFVLLGKNSEALERYKIAKALNPVDKELAAIVADLEAGKDISDRIPKPKGQKPPEETRSPDIAAAIPPAPSSPTQKAVSAAPVPVKEQERAPVPKASPAASAAAPVAQTVDATPELQPNETPDVLEVEAEEIVEEVLEADILEQPVSKKVTAKSPTVPAAETLPPIKPKSVDEPGSIAFDLGEAFLESQPEADHDAGEAWSPTEALPPAAGAADDINTDTLAELYISQGFYDKAIEIYQRMLADRPENKVLQQKLLKLHAMAGIQGAESFPVPPARTEVPAPAVRESAEPIVRRPVQQEVKPAASQPIPLGKAAPQAADAMTAPRDEQQTGRSLSDPAMRPDPGKGAEMVKPSGSTATARRKETIDRLESWLKNVVKEKPQ